VTAVVPAVMTSVVAVSMDGGHALARVVALAAQQGSPSPPAKARPIHKEGRTVHSPVHALSAPATPLDHAKIEIASPARAHALVSRQTHAQTSPYPATIAGITGSCWGVVESKGSHMGFMIRLALKLSTPPRSIQAPTAHPFA